MLQHFPTLNLWKCPLVLSADITSDVDAFLILPILIPKREKKINVNFYFNTSLSCLERFYE